MVCSSMILHGGSNAEKNNLVSEDAWKRSRIMKATVRILSHSSHTKKTHKGLIRLSLTDSQELQERTHVIFLQSVRRTL